MPPKAAAPHLWLKPLKDIERDEHHRYWLGDYQFPVSVTGVLAAGKSPIAMERIEATRDQWEARGNLVHKALELAATTPDWSPDLFPECWDYLDWVEPLMDHAIWQSTEVVASEFMLYQLDHTSGVAIAGTCDLILEVTDSASTAHPGRQRILLDLKTQANPKAGRYSTAAQLGGYITMAHHHGITIDRAATLWAKPQRCSLSSYSTQECIDAWQDALDHLSVTDTSITEQAAP